MAVNNSLNLRSPAVKRLLQEARELQQDQSIDYVASPLEDNIFEWHFVIRGPDNTEFEGGRYHGRIIFPSEYPFKPPNLMLLTPNGRFELNKKICLSITGYHPEYWLPAWGVRTVLLGLIGFMTTKANGAIGGIDYTESERKNLAVKSRDWICSSCGVSNICSLPDKRDDVKQENDNSTKSSPSKETATDAATANTASIGTSIPQFSFKYEDKNENNDTENINSIRDTNLTTKITSSGFGIGNDDTKAGVIDETANIAITAASSSSSTIIQKSPNHLQSTPLPIPPPTPAQQPLQPRRPTYSSPLSLFFLDSLIMTLICVVIGLVAKKISS
ncbi:8424_t:CDS:10 [Ambispora leptoticha]|uniref:8424_t:CDS:1 n=1 Tax=Ambispora leptoticha TaxID=144679 RepID=A0A9N8WGR9_9GLOM|nr:8424_t:CDS:10 [Ambispora leptoticha]